VVMHLIASGRRALGPCAAAFLLCWCAACALGAPLTYTPTSVSVSAKAGRSTQFSLLVQAPKNKTVTATAPEVTAILPNPIPAPWVSAVPAQATFGQSGQTFVISISVPAAAAPGTYVSQIGAHVTAGGGVQDGAGCLTTLTVTVNVAPTAAFTHAPGSPTTAELVAFTDASTDPDGSIVAWAWDFGDGVTSADQNPTHPYAHNGAYTVVLTVTDDDGSTGAVSHAITVVNRPPIAAFGYVPVNPSTTETVVFSDSSTDPDGSVVAWAWGFGDGATSSERNPTHRYAHQGVYCVMLTATDDDGGTSTATQQLAVSGVAPTAAFSYTPSDPTAEDTVTFTDQSSDLDGSIANWVWDFGDGATSFDQNPTHQYSEDGDYTVSLTVVDDDGASDSCSRAIRVGAPPAPALMSSEVLSLLYTGGRIVTEGASLRLSASAYDDFGSNQTANIAQMLSFSVLDAQCGFVAQPEIIRGNSSASSRADVTLSSGVYRIYADFPGNISFGPASLGPALVVVAPATAVATWGSLSAGEQEFALLLEPAVGETPMICQFAYYDSVEDREVSSTAVTSATGNGDAWQVSGECMADGVYGYEFTAALTQTDGEWVFVLEVSNGLTVQGTLDPVSILR
jgi:PKD repeat protein